MHGKGDRMYDIRVHVEMSIPNQERNRTNDDSGDQ